MQITQLKSQWRGKFQEASFRGAMFHVETDARMGGRRVALHQYPKRNTPYAEDMGRAANRFVVQGYIIGRSNENYLTGKDDLIEQLEKDGPGWLRLPLPYQMTDQYVMVMSYTVTEARERGGMCMVQMEFVEYGDPVYRQTVSTAEEINKSATKVEDNQIGSTDAWGDGQGKAAAPYADIYQGAGIKNGSVDIGDIESTTQ
jgi:prophage DNA circulation protein